MSSVDRSEIERINKAELRGRALARKGMSGFPGAMFDVARDDLPPSVKDGIAYGFADEFALLTHSIPRAGSPHEISAQVRRRTQLREVLIERLSGRDF
jgi:hypothetical protein